MPDCRTCKEKQTASNHALEVVAAEFHFVARRLVAAIVILAILFIGSNLVWIIRERQFEQTTTTTEYVIEADQEAEDGNNYAVNGDLNG